MNRYILFGLALLVISVTSCDDKTEISSLKNRKVAHCIMINSNNLKQLLSGDLINKVFLNSENAEIEESYSMILEYGYLEYSWENQRTKNIKLLEKQVSINQKDIISISGIRKTNQLDFLQRYTLFQDLNQDFSLKRVDTAGGVSLWNKKENKLYVYLGELQFIIRTDVDNENEINEKKSIEIANMIIENCLEK